MSIGQWLKRSFGRKDPPPSDNRPNSENSSLIRMSFHLETNPCVEVAGTTTFAKGAVAALADRRGLLERGFLETEARLQREPNNPVDPHAVAVIVEGEKVGNLPGAIARSFPLPAGASAGVLYQLHVLRGEKWLAKAYVWLGSGTPQWAYTAANPPPLTSRQRTLASAKQHSDMVKEALEGGGERARQFQQGMYQGVHYLQLIEPIKQLKRENRLEEALVLCYQAINGAERDRNGREPAPAYTEQAAIIHRKLGQHDEEIAVLERWLSFAPPDRRAGSSIAERHQKCLLRQRKGLEA